MTGFTQWLRRALPTRHQLTIADVRWGYRTVLGREPESDAIIEATRVARADLKDLVEVLIASGEYQQRNRQRFKFTPDAHVFPAIQPQSIAAGAKVYADRYQMLTDLPIPRG